jgi:hypothetical protein
VIEKGGTRYGNHHVRILFLPGGQPRQAVQAFRWNPRLLAPVL